MPCTNRAHSLFDITLLDFVRAGVAVIHVLHALIYLFVARSKGHFTCCAFLFTRGCVKRSSRSILWRSRPFLNFPLPDKFMLVCLLPVLGWAVWCFSKKSKQSAFSHGHEMAVRNCTFSHGLLHISWSHAHHTASASLGSFLMRANTSI
jgi:hypothetical protein